MKRWDVSFGDALTEREDAILLMLADGMTNAEIAVDCSHSIETIKDDVATLCEKLGARNRTHAVALAYHRSILRVAVA
jgi:DNA-binding CsgD family transcriptional regulator